MAFFDSRYYRINKFLMSAVGLWPYQESIVRACTLVIAVFGVMSMALPQAIFVYKYGNDINNMFSVIPALAAVVLLTFKVGIITYYSKKLKHVLDQVQNDWGILTEADEIRILEKHAENGRRFIHAYTISVIIPTLSYMLWPLSVPILDTFLPLNKSRSRFLIHPADYLVDQDKYYYMIYANEFLTYIIGFFIGVGCDGTYIILIEHSCGMFSVLSYRLENIWTRKLSVSKNSNRNDDHFRLIECIQLYMRIKEFIDKLLAVFTTYILMDIGPGLVMHSVACVLIAIYIDRPAQIGKIIALAFAQSCRLFLNSWPGQRLIDYSGHIWTSVYNTPWYKFSNTSRKLLVLIMMKTRIPCSITLANLYMVSLDNFGTIIKTSLSYCTVMASLNDK